ncbi:MAG TPA: hypothetical protein VFV86_08105, partial [Nitrososphaeraceae archaeon]|nr:hypothetical protein [Nitrososphaeraceae archaeon]
SRINDAISQFTNRGNPSNDGTEVQGTDDQATTNDPQSRINDAISQFTNRGNPSNDGTEVQGTDDQATTNDFTQFRNIFSGNPVDIIDRIGTSTNNGIDRIQLGIGPILQGLPQDAQDRVNDRFDDAQQKITDSLERAKYRISGSLPSGSGFN